VATERPVVAAAGSAAGAFDAAGAGDVRYTEYPQGNHNAWDATYADAAMWDWLFAQRR